MDDFINSFHLYFSPPSTLERLLRGCRHRSTETSRLLHKRHTGTGEDVNFVKCFPVLIHLTVIDSLCVLNLLQYRMVDPAHGALEESYTPDDDPQEVHSVFSEEGTARRSDIGVIFEQVFSAF